MNITPFSQVQGWAPVKPHSTLVKVVEILGVALGIWGVVVMLDVISSEDGYGATAVAGVLAFIPLIVVLGVVRWIDRWEPEPLFALVLAFVWGAGVATFISLVFNTVVAEVLMVTNMTETTQLAISSAVAAPFVEEFTKGLGVLLVFFFRRRGFDGPVDGVVYAAVVAAGFAFVENILYFTQFSDEIAGVFIGRAIMSPFAHVVFTAMTGLMLGIAARSCSRFAWIGLFPLGLFLAMLLHGLWNFSTLSTRYFTLYVFLQVPLFITAVALVYWLRHFERQVLRYRLGEYSRAGWFSDGEVRMLTSLQERRRARSWAAKHGRRKEMKSFQTAATDLAYQRERHAMGSVPAGAYSDQQILLGTVTQARAALFA